MSAIAWTGIRVPLYTGAPRMISGSDSTMRVASAKRRSPVSTSLRADLHWMRITLPKGSDLNPPRWPLRRSLGLVRLLAPLGAVRSGGLLVAQGDDRVYACGAARGDVAGQSRDGGKDHGHGGESGDIRGLDPVQQAGHDAGGAEGC